MVLVVYAIIKYNVCARAYTVCTVRYRYNTIMTFFI